MLQTLSIGAGGGSIAWVNHELGGQLNVGPRSAARIRARSATTRAAPSRPLRTRTSCSATSIQTTSSRRMTLKEAVTRGDQPDGRPARHRARGGARIRRLIDGTMGEGSTSRPLRGYDGSSRCFAFGGAGPMHAFDMADYSGRARHPHVPSSAASSMRSACRRSPCSRPTTRTDVVRTYVGQAFPRTSEDFNAVTSELVEGPTETAEEGFAAGSPARARARHGLLGPALTRHSTAVSPLQLNVEDVDRQAGDDFNASSPRRTGTDRSTRRAAFTCGCSGSSPPPVVRRSASSSAHGWTAGAPAEKGTSVWWCTAGDSADTPVLDGRCWRRVSASRDRRSWRTSTRSSRWRPAGSTRRARQRMTEARLMRRVQSLTGLG